MSSRRRPPWWQIEGWQTRARPLWLVERNDGSIRALGFAHLSDPQRTRDHLRARGWMDEPAIPVTSREWGVASFTSLRLTITSRINGNLPRAGKLEAFGRELGWRRTGPPVLRESPKRRNRRFLPARLDAERDPRATRLWGRVSGTGELDLFSAFDHRAACRCARELFATKVVGEEIEPVEGLDLELTQVNRVYHPIRYRLELFGHSFEWSLTGGPPSPPKGPLAAELCLPIPRNDRPRAVSDSSCPLRADLAGRASYGQGGSGVIVSRGSPDVHVPKSASPVSRAR